MWTEYLQANPPPPACTLYVRNPRPYSLNLIVIKQLRATVALYIQSLYFLNQEDHPAICICRVAYQDDDIAFRMPRPSIPEPSFPSLHSRNPIPESSFPNLHSRDCIPEPLFPSLHSGTSISEPSFRHSAIGEQRTLSASALMCTDGNPA